MCQNGWLKPIQMFDLDCITYYGLFYVISCYVILEWRFGAFLTQLGMPPQHILSEKIQF